MKKNMITSLKLELFESVQPRDEGTETRKRH